MDNKKILNPILIVEDNPDDLDLTIRAFKHKKIDNFIQVARDGEEALDFINRWEKGEPKPIVILLDLNLPKVSGLEFLEVLKNHQEFKTIPVVILTTSAESSDMKSSYQLGANSYILKPVDFSKFVEAVGDIGLYWLLLNQQPE